jgi:hypothetical protein
MNKIIKKYLTILRTSLNPHYDRGTVLLSRYCISSFMTRSNTNCRTALVAPTAGDSIREAHSY